MTEPSECYRCGKRLLCGTLCTWCHDQLKNSYQMTAYPVCVKCGSAVAHSGELCPRCQTIVNEKVKPTMTKKEKLRACKSLIAQQEKHSDASKQINELIQILKSELTYATIVIIDDTAYRWDPHKTYPLQAVETTKLA